jgi:carbonic anhydrase
MQPKHREGIIPSDIAPAGALQELKAGNFRFINNLNRNHDLLEMVNETKDGQYPFASIVSCMDSRTSAELIFDQGLGDIFSIRIAGNVITDEVLGSLEYATAVAGSHLVVVLGHTNCGAIRGACDHVELGHLTGLLQQIQPAMDQASAGMQTRNSSNPEYVAAVTSQHTIYSANEIYRRSQVIAGLVEQGKVGIVPAVYDVATGKVQFLEAHFLHKPQLKKTAEMEPA